MSKQSKQSNDPILAWKHLVLNCGGCPINPSLYHEYCPWELTRPVPKHLWHPLLAEIGMTCQMEN